MVDNHIVEWEVLHQLLEFTVLPCQNSKPSTIVGNGGTCCRYACAISNQAHTRNNNFSKIYLNFTR